MADQRLVLGLSSWLRDSDVPAPDARMSASRVMAGVDTTKRLGRFWPPARLVGAVEPAAELGTFGPAGPTGHSEQHVPSPALGARVRELVTPVRALAAAVVVALIGTVVLLGSSFPSSSPTPEPAAAAVAPVVEKSPLPAVVVVPPPTATPRPAPTPRPEPSATPDPVVAASEPSHRTFDWLDGGVRMEANALRLNIAGKSLSAEPGEKIYASNLIKPAQFDGFKIRLVSLIPCLVFVKNVAQHLIGSTTWRDSRCPLQSNFGLLAFTRHQPKVCETF